MWNGEIVPQLEITEVILVHSNVVNNDYQHDLRVLSIFLRMLKLCWNMVYW